MAMNLRMVDLHGQYQAIKSEIDEAIQQVIDATAFIKGPAVGEFECQLAGYLDGQYALGVANGTDALQVALMALGIGPGDEVITPAFTFVATAEAAALLGAVPVFADIDPATFNIDHERVEELITPLTRAIVPVHLFGQPANMDGIMDVARRHNLAVVEDNAQGVGSTFNGRRTGLIGDIGTLSFFPSKNLGCYGDGGAVVTNDEALYEKMKMIASHGSRKKYFNEMVGVNSRLDAIQAAILSVKLRHLDSYTAARREAADRYDELLADVPYVETPMRDARGVHVFHQYTIRVAQDTPGGRDGLAAHLRESGIPHAVYYPVPLSDLPVFADHPARSRSGRLDETQRACREVLSLPMHTELTVEQQHFIADAVATYATSTISAAG